MAQLFILAAQTEAASAAIVAETLAANGYAIWKLPAHLSPDSASYAAALEAGIRGSGAIVLLWSNAAASDEWVERSLLYAQRLTRPIVGLVPAANALPVTPLTASSVIEHGDLVAAIQRLVPALPPPTDEDLLLALLTHTHIREKKRGIAEAIELIKRGERREEMLAILEDIERNDLFDLVRAEARTALATVRAAAPPPTTPAASRHVFGIRCAQGHVSYYDKREVCPSDGMFARSAVRKAGKDLDELLLSCRTAGCSEKVVVCVDCEGYRP